MGKTLYSREQQALSAALRQARLEAGLRQADLAHLLGKRQSFVSDIESGQRRVDVVELRRICQHLGVTLAAFIARWEATLDTMGDEN
jgi:transcriptional regulator with XRE-family HTH domain